MGLLKSKKFISALLAAIIAFIAEMMGVPHDQVLLMVAPFLAYIGAQGLADLGKEKALREKE
jgi:hypothetical protein